MPAGEIRDDGFQIDVVIQVIAADDGVAVDIGIGFTEVVVLRRQLTATFGISRCRCFVIIIAAVYRRKRTGIGGTDMTELRGSCVAFLIGFVFRNQLRKSAPNLLDGYDYFCKQSGASNAYLLLHTYWKEGWDIPRLIKEKNIDPSRILTTYLCQKCQNYEIKPYSA